MSSKIKQKIAKNFYDAIQNKFYNGRCEDLFGWFNLIKDKKNKIFWRINVPLNYDYKPDTTLLLKCQSELVEENIIKEINTYYSGKQYDLELELKPFIKDVLDSNPVSLSYKLIPKNVIVEFSSPNIAKPFHVGHLRSTIIGNCIANIKKKLGQDVVKMNYLGDWGTQFGLIQVGVILEKYTDNDLEKDPIRKLYKAYVRGNKEAEVNPDIFEKAKKMFCDLESGEEGITNSWNKYRSWAIKELVKLYENLGVHFDEYEWESDYNRKEAEAVLNLLREKDLLTLDEKGRMTVTVGNNIVAPLIKSDNTTLYLLRDLMAVIKRRSKYKFDELYYVVENAQNHHFNSLFGICNELNLDQGIYLRHVKFGRIHGMSTRKGKVVFLSDILEEAQERCYKKQASTKTTKSSLNSENESRILGISAVIVNDLKKHRKKDYEFSWENILQLKGQTGIQLQYCHCRLVSLNLNCNINAASECDPEALLEPEAIDVILAMARLEETLYHANSTLEPCILVAYLFNLVKAINTAFKVLPVKNSDQHLASQRLLLFNKSREVLHEGMTLLGLKALNKM